MIWNVLFTALLASGIGANLQCRDESGNAVDWFVVYKLPRITSSTTTLLQDGLSYMYITSEDNDGWTVSSQKIGDDSSILAQTISPMYDNSTEALWIVYNDQGTAPETSSLTSHAQLEASSYSSSYGHTKGMVGGDEEGGFWLIHSVPHFPGLDYYTYPKTGRLYGQSAMCVSMDADNLDLVGNLFKFDQPDILQSSISDSLTSVYPNLVSASEGTTSSTKNMSVVLTSKAGTEFTGFGKSKKFGADLYEWVASTLGTDLYVEAWRNQANLLNSSCDISYKVINILSVEEEDAGVSFETTHDHSKWAVSTSSSDPWVCVGDINRAVSQEKRGGGTMCTSNKKLWSAYSSLVSSTEEC